MKEVVAAVNEALAGKYLAKTDLVNWEAYPQEGATLGKWWSRSICYARALSFDLSGLESGGGERHKGRNQQYDTVCIHSYSHGGDHTESGRQPQPLPEES